MNNWIFDYGGTLDTGGHHWGKVIWHAYERLHVPVTEQQFRDAYVFAERALAKQPIIQPDFTFSQTLEAKLSIQLQWLNDNVTLPKYEGSMPFCIKDYRLPLLSLLMDGVKARTQESRSVLEALKQRGDRMVLVSNFYGNINAVLCDFNLDGLFEDIIESAVVGIRKPDPRIFELGVKALGVEAQEVTVVGDSMEKDILPAKSIGCHTIWIKGEHWSTDNKEKDSNADHTITQINNILNIIDETKQR